MSITNQEELRNLYGWPSGRAQNKVLPELEKHSLNFIEKSPFLVMSTYSIEGKCDASPKGGHAGFVKVLDKKTLLIPDAKGNNRVDSLVNIVETGGVGCIFMIPGIEETLRINGTAVITTDKEFIKQFSSEKNVPISCIKITVQEVFLHCAKAFMRSDLWGVSNRQTRPGFPTMGTMLNEQLKTENPKIESQDDMIKRYKKDL